MDKDRVEQILNVLEDISLPEWESLKSCVDREFRSQSCKLKLTASDNLLAALELSLIH